MTAADIQARIFEAAGLKTSVKKGTGSMKGYVIIWPIFQGGKFPSLPFDFVQELKRELQPFNSVQHPVFCSTNEISVYGISDDRTEFKKERKPLPIEQQKVKMWGSKNSQIRLDKAIRRNAKNMQKGNTARYM